MLKKLKIKFREQKGIALLMVLSTLMILTTAIVEFTYTSRINYQLAVNAKERLQAYYLARSALNFSKLILKYNKEAEKLIESAGSQASSLGLEPLYKMIPLSSELIRGVASGQVTELFQTTGADETSDPSDPSQDELALAEEGETVQDEDKSAEEKVEAKPSLLAQDEAEKFLSFEGDFSAEITEEQTKFDLNKINGIVSNTKAYDQRKKMFLAFLMNPKFEKLFENHSRDAEALVHALSDWVDPNGVINEFEGVEQGDEDSLYTGQHYPVKNGKMMTLSEMRLVAGMDDALYQELEKDMTVYPAGDKMNICLGNEDWLSALIYFYTHEAGCASPVDYEDEEKLKELQEAVLSGCPDVDVMATLLNTNLGLVAGNDEITDTEETSDQQDTSGASVNGCAFQFKDLITGDNNIFKIKAIGTVGETELTLTVVLNVDQSDPTQWKYYYYRID